ncbi:MAG: Holliday junction branch migration protein RuvA [Deltaproteobacteria bacterium]|nr:Holliday junction branch migration protein RuvA [Deltaproteobacteria bacterium]
MIAKISGTLEHKVPGEVIVDVAGVGYHIFIPLNVFYRLPEVGGTISLHIHTHLREDALQLFGFMEQEEKHIFLLLNGVAGIGPKLALNILSGIPVEELADGSQLTRDAVSALVNLGYRQGEAERSVREVARQGEATLAEVLKEALRRLSQ